MFTRNRNSQSKSKFQPSSNSSRFKSNLNDPRSKQFDLTSRDWIARTLIKIEEEPLSTLKLLRELLSKTSQSSHRPRYTNLEALQYLFLEVYLPGDRSLSYLHERPSQAPSKEEYRIWKFEDVIKTVYIAYLKLLEETTSDTVEFGRTFSLKLLADLMTQKPEQRLHILSIIVNKLGDPVPKVSSKAQYLLNIYLESNPDEKLPVVSEISRLINRKNCGFVAKYYSFLTLSQIKMRRDTDTNIANLLLRIYLSHFESNASHLEKPNKGTPTKTITSSISSPQYEKLINVILTGANRILPYCNVDSDTKGDESDILFFQESLHRLFKIAYTTSARIRLLSLSFLFTICSKPKYEKHIDRFYSCFYNFLSCSEVIYISKIQTQFLNLFLKVVQHDIHVGRKRALVKRLLGTCCAFYPPHLICATLLVLDQLFKQKLINVLEAGYITQEPELETEITETTSTQAKYGSLVGLPDNNNNSSNEPKNSSQSQRYDPFARNPKYCNAQYSTFVELELLKLHFHPSVVVFASQLAAGKRIRYSGNPFHDFSYIKWLTDKVSPKSKSKSTVSKT